MDGTGGTFGRQGYSLVSAVTSFHPFSSLSVVLRRRMSGPCGFEIPGGAGETTQGTVGDELAACVCSMELWPVEHRVSVQLSGGF